MDTRAYPGHCRMLLERQGSNRSNQIQNALFDDGQGNAILSSGCYLDEYAKTQTLRGRRVGPSLPISLGPTINMDFVHAIRCQCPSILQRWAERPRHLPAPDVVLKVVSLGSVVTPVSFKGSEFKFFEWRICFNTGETELINNMNVNQTKVYVILKMIIRDVLKPKKKELTSYMLKNIIFWQAESNTPAMFQDRN
ncbi:hypothetical protein DPMN_040690 [Dreissena polymorpha]|uniref:Uncharacterized protein n=1 Tax=Dreissena polymorpha TaxID=45954 RepID=A0A9D4CVH8_DREPO|nr:hypothetical protein DPMN_040690 [Dreissena polymorpha]